MAVPSRTRNGQQSSRRSQSRSRKSSSDSVLRTVITFFWAVIVFIFSIIKVVFVTGWKVIKYILSDSSSPETATTSALNNNNNNGTFKVIEGNPNMGSFHSLIRHASQWMNVIPGFRKEWSKLPKEAKTLVAKVEKGEESSKNFLNSLAKLNLSAKIFSPLEKQTSRFIAENATAENLKRVGQNSSGKIKHSFSVTNSAGRSSELVLGVEGAGKPVITAYFKSSSSSSLSKFSWLSVFKWTFQHWQVALAVGFVGYLYYIGSSTSA